jgi:hypothetical protein
MKETKIEYVKKRAKDDFFAVFEVSWLVTADSFFPLLSLNIIN